MHPIDTVFRRVLRDVVDEINRDIDELMYDLEDWFDEMLSHSPIWSEWRDSLSVFVRRWHERGIDITPESVRKIEALMEDIVRYEAEYLEAQAAGSPLPDAPQLGAMNLGDVSGPLVPGIITGADEPPPEMASLPSTGSIEQMRELGKFLADPFYKARIKKIHYLRSVWDDYDQEIASGRHKPGWIEWAGTGVGRVLMPPSPPDIVIEFEDGSKLVIPGGGPSSGQLAGQGLAIAGPYGAVANQATLGAAAAAYGRTFVRQQVESGIDFVFQEATGSPIGPSLVVPKSVPKTYARPSGFRKGIREKVWQSASDIEGTVRDPLTGMELEFDEPWDMGHKPGFEFRKHQQSAVERQIDRQQFLDEHNDPIHYRPEHPSSNRSHAGELKTNDYFGQ